MLVELTIRDFALIERLHVSFSERFNVITGETGAGKSILIGALGTLMGERTGPDVIRSGADRALVEARFKLPDGHPAFDIIHDLGGEADGGEVILRRELIPDGRTRVWIGGVSATVTALRGIGDRLVDFHGQHDHQLLLSQSEHVGLLDAFAGNGERLALVAERYQSLRSLRAERKLLLKQQEETESQREMLEFERDELSEIDPKNGELESLESERNVLGNVENLANLLNGLTHLLSEAEDSIVSKLGSGRRWMHDAAGIDTSLEELTEQYEQMEVYAQETAQSLADRLAQLEADPLRLEQVQTRIGQLRKLVRRYGSVEAAIARREELHQLVDDDAGLVKRIGEVEGRIIDEYRAFAKAVQALSKARREGAERMATDVTAYLSHLGMERARFDVDLGREAAGAVDPVESDAVEVDGEPVVAGPDGAEQVEFLIAPNLGEPMRPLVKIASGGEISRIMLAIKSAVSEHDPVVTMVFDEIDAGVSGRIAEAVGDRMRELSRHRQIIAITHLPQIAAFGDEHIVVAKHEEAERTVTEARVLSGDDRPRAIAELFGGAAVTETALQHARTLLEERQ